MPDPLPATVKVLRVELYPAHPGSGGEPMLLSDQPDGRRLTLEKVAVVVAGTVGGGDAQSHQRAGAEGNRLDGAATRSR